MVDPFGMSYLERKEMHVPDQRLTLGITVLVRRHGLSSADTLPPLLLPKKRILSCIIDTVLDHLMSFGHWNVRGDDSKPNKGFKRPVSTIPFVLFPLPGEITAQRVQLFGPGPGIGYMQNIPEPHPCWS